MDIFQTKYCSITSRREVMRVQRVTMKLLHMFNNKMCRRVWDLHFADSPLFRLVSQWAVQRHIYIIKLVLRKIGLWLLTVIINRCHLCFNNI